MGNVAPGGGEIAPRTCGSPLRGWVVGGVELLCHFQVQTAHHVECTRKPSYSLPHAQQSKRGKKDGAFALPVAQHPPPSRRHSSTFCPPSSLWWPLLQQLLHFSLFSPSQCGWPSMTYSSLSLCTSLYMAIQLAYIRPIHMPMMYTTKTWKKLHSFFFVWRVDSWSPTGNSMSWQERTHHLQMILQLIYL